MESHRRQFPSCINLGSQKLHNPHVSTPQRLSPLSSVQEAPCSSVLTLSPTLLFAPPSMPPFSFVSGRLLPTPVVSRFFPGMATGGSSPASFPRRLVILAFCFDTSSRVYALFEDTQRPFQGSYAPHIYAVALAFALEAFLEVWWIRNLGRPASAQEAADEEEGVFVNNEKSQAVETTQREGVAQSLSEEVTTAEFIPLYIVGSLFQGA